MKKEIVIILVVFLIIPSVFAKTRNHLVINSDTEIIFAENDGTGKFTITTYPGSDLAAGTESGIYGIAIADFDLDGINDIVASLHYEVDIYWGGKEGSSIVFLQEKNVFNTVNPHGLDVGDFNEDGWPDVLVTDKSGSTSLTYWGDFALNNQKKGFVVKRDWRYEILTKSSYNDVAVADFNGDGFDDIISSGYYLGKGDVTFEFIEYGVGVGLAIIHDFGDIDNDGDLDFITSMGLYKFADRKFIPYKTIKNGKFFDVNEDGFLDIITLNANKFSVLLWDKELNDYKEKEFFLASPASDLEIADFDEDGHGDIILVSQPADKTLKLRVLKGDGKGGFESIYSEEYTIPRKISIIDTATLYTENMPEASFLRGDSNNDGNVDVSDAVYLLEYLFRNGPSPECLDAGDANDDGILDISDAVKVLLFLFGEGQNLPAPYPNVGIDPTEDRLSCG